MLNHLTIKNYALIHHLEMDLSSHMNVITGETGAGKSIMLGAIGLLLGNRADTKVLWDENEKCVTEGVFQIKDYGLKSLFESFDLDYDEQTVIRREISAGGKSRAFINDTPVTLDVMKKIGGRLMDIHSQHETLDLANRFFQLQVIDSFASNSKITEEYSKCWVAFTTARKNYELLLAEANHLRQESDFVKFQLSELTDAQLVQDEQVALEDQLKIMEHAEDIKTKFNAAIGQLDRSDISVITLLNEVKTLLGTVSNFSESYQKLYDRLESTRIELNDLVSELDREEQRIEFDPEKIEETKERLSLIYQLLQKHRVTTISELLVLKDQLQHKADKTDNLDEALGKAKENLDSTSIQLNKKAAELSKSRQKVFNDFCMDLVGLLKSLGIPEASIKVDHQSVEPGPTGADMVELLFSANKGIAVKPLAAVASGGEFSRLMFCIKYMLAEKTALPTLVLDEIDTGVSGEIAIRLGRMMNAMAKKHQLIAISHLPQIAARADRHFFTYKESKSEKTRSKIRQLSQDERIAEIAKMIGGEKPSALALENARELIAG